MIGSDFHYGVLLKHRPEAMTFELPQPTTAISFELMKQGLGREYWHKLYNYPRFGVAVIGINYGNKEVLGKAFGIHPQVDIPIWRKRKFGMYARLGFGFSIIPTRFDREENTENVAIGSLMNNHTTLGFIAEQGFGDHFVLRIGGSLTHNSNGKVQIPNLGLNTAKLRVGVSYRLEPVSEYVEYDYTEVPAYKKPVANIRVGMGFTEKNTDGGPRHPILIIAAFATKMSSRRNKWLFGYEASLDMSNRAFLRDQEIPEEEAGLELKVWRHALIGGHEFMFGRFGFMTQAFIYMDPPFAGESSWGAKLGPNLYILAPYKHPRRNFFLGGYLKAHGAIAAFIELTAGASF